MSDENPCILTNWPRYTAEVHKALRRTPPRHPDADPDLAAVDFRSAFERVHVALYELWLADRRCQSKAAAPMIAGAMLLPTTGRIDLDDNGVDETMPPKKRTREKKAVSP